MKLSKEQKRWVVSTSLTFFSGFFMVIGTNLATLNGEAFTIATFIGIILAALRGGFKAILEYYTK